MNTISERDIPYYKHEAFPLQNASIEAYLPSLESDHQVDHDAHRMAEHPEAKSRYSGYCLGEDFSTCEGIFFTDNF